MSACTRETLEVVLDDATLGPAKAIKREHALAIDASDPTPSLRHLHATHRYYRLRANEAAAIEHEVREAVARWRSVADELKLGRMAQDQLAAVIDAART